MRMRMVRMVLWIGTVFLLLGIPAVNAVADGAGQVPWIVNPAPSSTVLDGPGPVPWIVGPVAEGPGPTPWIVSPAPSTAA